MLRHGTLYRDINRYTVDTERLKFQLLKCLCDEAPCDCCRAHAERLIPLIRGRDALATYYAVIALPQHENCGAPHFRWVQRCIALFKKHVDRTISSNFDPEQTAWDKFRECEDRCASVNRAFSDASIFKGGVLTLLSDMRALIRHVLGDVPSMKRIRNGCAWGPGAAIGVHGDATSWGRKISTERITGNTRCAHLAFDALRENNEFSLLFRSAKGSEALSKVEWVTYNTLSFVPKTVECHRSIAVEPLLVAYVQKGIDLEMRRKLHLRCSIDLSDQTANQRRARLGSLDGSQATIDLSSASDSISCELVRYLLPPEWWDLVSSVRSPEYLYKGQRYRYHKYGSMGNGVVFPLQTLIFWACAKASGSSDPLVYGDDIIVESAVAQSLIRNLECLGFRTNPGKTFFEGPFRESCGSDWYNGQPVRAAYFDCETRSGNIPLLIAFHNTASILGYPESFLALIRKSVPEAVRRLVRPSTDPGYGAFNLSVDAACSSPYVRWDRRQFCWTWYEISLVPVRDKLWHLPPWLREELEYQAVLRGSPSQQPFSFRRKTKLRLRRMSGWPLPLDVVPMRHS